MSDHPAYVCPNCGHGTNSTGALSHEGTGPHADMSWYKCPSCGTVDHTQGWLMAAEDAKPDPETFVPERCPVCKASLVDKWKQVSISWDGDGLVTKLSATCPVCHSEMVGADDE